MVAVEPLTDAAFAFACHGADADVIVVDAARKAPFALPRAAISAARGRGLVFEVCYGDAVARPRTLRHLVATASRIAAATDGGDGVALSSGAADAWQVRAPADVAAIAAMVGVKRALATTTNGALALARASERAAKLGIDDAWVSPDVLRGHLRALRHDPAAPRPPPKKRKAATKTKAR